MPSNLLFVPNQLPVMELSFSFQIVFEINSQFVKDSIFLP